MNRGGEAPDQFEVLVDVLSEVQSGVSDGSPQVEYRDDVAYAEMRRGVGQQIRESPRARLTLFSLALAALRERTESPAQLHRELRQFARAVEDRFGVDVLRTAARHRDELPEIPEALFDTVRADGGGLRE